MANFEKNKKLPVESSKMSAKRKNDTDWCLDWDVLGIPCTLQVMKLMNSVEYHHKCQFHKFHFFQFPSYQ